MNGRPIRVTQVAGTAREMGGRHGSAHAEEIRAYTSDRVVLSAAGTDWGPDRILALAESMLPAHEKYDPDLYEEMSGMAEAAGISAAEAVIVGGYTDFIDTVRAEAGSGSYEDACTAVVVPDALADGTGFLAQTWDMHASATPHIVLLDIRPASGPAALVFTTVGTLGQIGMNEAGIAVGINNLTADDGKLGVTWPFVVRKALRRTDFDSAVAAVVDADLAGGHNFLVFDAAGRGVSIEAMPTVTHIERLDGAVIAHTNHCLSLATRRVEGARPADLVASSTLRLGQAPGLLDERPVTVETLMAMTRDDRAICRYPVPPDNYESCGAAIMRPSTGDFWACWGIPAENQFEHFVVGRG